MVTINYKLQKIAENLFIKYKSTEREYIDKKIINFKNSIKEYFGNKVNDILVFGSYKRDTILPRKYDEKSDIDVLIVFDQEENEFTPETYRNQLIKFAEIKYPKTTRLKNHPSVVLEMSNIKFDLVPCRIKRSFWKDKYQIPDKTGDWMDTDPTGFNQDLTDANTRYSSIVKPIIRLLKCWNANSGYPYYSFDLEQIIADLNFKKNNYESGFLYAIENLPIDDLPDYQARRVETLKNNKDRIEDYLERENQEKAMEVVYRILGVKI